MTSVLNACSFISVSSFCKLKVPHISQIDFLPNSAVAIWSLASVDSVEKSSLHMKRCLISATINTIINTDYRTLHNQITVLVMPVTHWSTFPFSCEPWICPWSCACSYRGRGRVCGRCVTGMATRATHCGQWSTHDWYMTFESPIQQGGDLGLHGHVLGDARLCS